MKTPVKITLPEEVMEHMPADRRGMIEYLSRLFDEEADEYSSSIQRRAGAPLNGPLSRYERSLIKDYLLDKIVNANHYDEETQDRPLASVG